MCFCCCFSGGSCRHLGLNPPPNDSPVMVLFSTNKLIFPSQGLHMCFRHGHTKGCTVVLIFFYRFVTRSVLSPSRIGRRGSKSCCKTMCAFFQPFGLQKISGDKILHSDNINPHILTPRVSIILFACRKGGL